MLALLALYEAVRVPLVEDRLAEARTAAQQIDVGDGASGELVAAAAAVAASTDLDAARKAFAELSRTFVVDLAATESDGLVKVFRCPMVEGYAYWVQAGAGLANPYMGQRMPACGEGASFKAAHKDAVR